MGYVVLFIDKFTYLRNKMIRNFQQIIYKPNRKSKINVSFIKMTIDPNIITKDL